MRPILIRTGRLCEEDMDAFVVRVDDSNGRVRLRRKDGSEHEIVVTHPEHFVLCTSVRNNLLNAGCIYHGIEL